MGSAARISSNDAPIETISRPLRNQATVTPLRPLTVLLVVPTLHAGAADTGVIEMVRILTAAGHRALVLSRGGRLDYQVTRAGGKLIIADVASKNPLVMLRNVFGIRRILRAERCDIVHAHGRVPAWSAYFATRGAPCAFLTTWHKGFREQNLLKRLYNSVMVRGDRIVAVSEQIAELVYDRYRVARERLCIVPASVDFDRFDPAAIAPERLDAIRRQWGVPKGVKVVLVAGRMLRRKGHHDVVKAVCRLKEMGMRNFVCVFVGEDEGHGRYSGELWDLVLATDTADLVRMTGPVDDLPAAYAAASVVVSAATQEEGLQRSILEAQAMARPVLVSDLSAGPDVVLAPPTVPEDRMTGLRFSAGDDHALAAALVRLFSMSDAERRAIGMRGRAWVIGHFNAPTVAELTLKAYEEVSRCRADLFIR